MLSFTDAFKFSPFNCRSSVMSAIRRRMASLGELDPHCLAVDPDGAGVCAAQAKHGFHDFGPSRAHQSGKTQHFALSGFEADVLKQPVFRQPLHFQRDFAFSRTRLWETAR